MNGWAEFYGLVGGDITASFIRVAVPPIVLPRRRGAAARAAAGSRPEPAPTDGAMAFVGAGLLLIAPCGRRARRGGAASLADHRCGRGRLRPAELVGGHASGSVPFLTAPVRWARAARMAALSVGHGTSTVRLLPVALWVTTPRKAPLPTVKPGGRSYGGLVTLSRKVLDRCSRLAVTSSPSALAATK